MVYFLGSDPGEYIRMIGLLFYIVKDILYKKAKI